MNKIRLNLFDLKAKEDLISIRDIFSKSLKRWFKDDSTPKDEFFHIRPCPLCASNESYEIFEIEGFSYHKCSLCESIYTKPHLNDGVLDSLYSDGTYQVYQDNLVKKGSKIRKGILEKRKFEQIQSIVKASSPTILDVGCGGGTFLEICKESKWQVEGVDPSPDSLKEGFVVHLGNFNALNFQKQYDVITFWGVLEHLFDPMHAVKKSINLLKNDGLMVFEVPSADSFITNYLEKYKFIPTRYIESARHNIFFSKALIYKIANENNLVVENIETNGLDIQTIILEEFEEALTNKLINMQDILNDLLLGDHYRVFLRKK